MAQIDLTKYGIKGTTEVVYNPSYEQLFKDEWDPNLEGYEKGHSSIYCYCYKLYLILHTII